MSENHPLNTEPNFNDIEADGIQDEPTAFREQLTVRVNDDIPPADVVAKIDGVDVFTTGNISTIIGKAKSKKTFFLTGLVAALSSGQWGEIEGTLKGRKIMWIDTEQAKFHTKEMLIRVQKLGADMEQIDCLNFRTLSPADRLARIEEYVYQTDDVGFLIIDGVRDLITSINDEEQATEVSTKLMKWSAELELHICVVLHTNKGDNNARGHVGSELMNKSESTLMVEKSEQDETVSLVRAEFTRGREFETIAFNIDADGLPQPADKPEAKQRSGKISPSGMMDQTHLEILRAIFKKGKAYKYATFTDEIINSFAKRDVSFGRSKCREFITYYQDREYVKKVGQEYQFTRPVI